MGSTGNANHLCSEKTNVDVCHVPFSPSVTHLRHGKRGAVHHRGAHGVSAGLHDALHVRFRVGVTQSATIGSGFDCRCGALGALRLKAHTIFDRRAKNHVNELELRTRYKSRAPWSRAWRLVGPGEGAGRPWITGVILSARCARHSAMGIRDTV